MRPFSMSIIQTMTCYFLELKLLLIEFPFISQHLTHNFELQQQKHRHHLDFSQLVHFEWFPSDLPLSVLLPSLFRLKDFNRAMV